MCNAGSALILTLNCALCVFILPNLRWRYVGSSDLPLSDRFPFDTSEEFVLLDVTDLKAHIGIYDQDIPYKVFCQFTHIFWEIKIAVHDSLNDLLGVECPMVIVLFICPALAPAVMI